MVIIWLNKGGESLLSFYYKQGCGLDPRVRIDFLEGPRVPAVHQARHSKASLRNCNFHQRRCVDLNLRCLMLRAPHAHVHVNTQSWYYSTAKCQTRREKQRIMNAYHKYVPGCKLVYAPLRICPAHKYGVLLTHLFEMDVAGWG